MIITGYYICLPITFDYVFVSIEKQWLLCCIQGVQMY